MDESITEAYRNGQRRLLLLDYDGTLIRFAPTPAAAHPNPQLLALLKDLAEQPGNTVVIISGRDQETLERTFAGVPVSLAAEHGCFLKDSLGEWRTICAIDQNWKPAIEDTMQTYVNKLSGAFIERKATSLVWHYRLADAHLGKNLAGRLTTQLARQVRGTGMRVVPGHKIVEVCTADTDKSKAALHWLDSASWDFVLAVGDDTTDEDMFAAMPDTAFTIKIGRGHTLARQRLPNPAALQRLLMAEIQSTH
ncbi:MAG TPA: trehalose-phosphatase [Patescibacteria group bacterium]|nr:trehalose-phosphatase [Patescibacteria group bacterium]